MKQRWITAIVLILATAVFATNANSQTNTDSSFQFNNNDMAVIDSAIANFYQTLSFTAVDQNRYNDLPQLFTAQGLLISAIGDKPYFWTVQEYAQLAEDNFKKQKMETWDEEEICSQTQVFGKIAQRFSTYKIIYVAGGRETVRRGINAIQLINEGGKWLIVSVAWDRENNTTPIPAEYDCQ